MNKGTCKSYTIHFLSLAAALILALALMNAIMSASAFGSPVKGMSKGLVPEEGKGFAVVIVGFGVDAA